MNAVEVSTVVFAPRAEIYDFLLDFTGYGRYSSYIEHIERTGDGGPGTRYDITVSWWKLDYTANSEVTATDRPDRIDWRLVGALEAGGYWGIEPMTDADAIADALPAGVGSATENDEDGQREASRVVLRIEYDPDSVSSRSLSLPAFVPVDAVVDRVAPHVQGEAESIVEDVVEELEGERRPVELTVHERPESV